MLGVFSMNIIVSAAHFLLLSFTLNLPLLEIFLGFNTPVLINAVIVIYFILFNVFPTFRKYPDFRLKVLGDGAELLLQFMLTCAASIPVLVIGIMRTVSGDISGWTLALYCILLVIGEAVIFWNGIIRVYLTSVQLAMRYRLLGIAFGLVPIANIVMLLIIYRKARHECRVETQKAKLNEARKDEHICALKYPVLLVHGVFFRDSALLNYWGRIPAELEKNGAVIYYGNQQSAASVENSAAELAVRIKSIVEETGCEKLNIIAHSKGGLDSRYAISVLGCDKYVASLTTINTPHRGCLFAEYILNNASDKFKAAVEKTYNGAFRRLGDDSPDFMAAVTDLTNSRCAELNEKMPDMPGVYYQSVCSKAKKARSGRFPLNFSYPLVKKYDGDNDGLVSMESAQWGEKFIPLVPTGKRGITHADMIDLNREDFPGFDVREFYVQLVSGLREMGF